MSGYSIVTGHSDDRKTIVQMPVTSTRDEIGRWTTLAPKLSTSTTLASPSWKRNVMPCARP